MTAAPVGDLLKKAARAYRAEVKAANKRAKLWKAVAKKHFRAHGEDRSAEWYRILREREIARHERALKVAKARQAAEEAAVEAAKRASPTYGLTGDALRDYWVKEAIKALK